MNHESESALHALAHNIMIAIGHVDKTITEAHKCRSKMHP